MATKNPTPEEMRKVLTEVRAGLRQIQREVQELIAFVETRRGANPPASSGR